jgi:hypothetical protein
VVGVRPEDELVAAIGDARTRVLAHRAWHSGSHRVDTLLEMATRIRQMEIDNLGATLPPWETVLGLLISWHHQVPVARSDGARGRGRDRARCRAYRHRPALVDLLHELVPSCTREHVERLTYEPGRELGKQAGAWATWLGSIPGVLVAKEVKLFAPGGKQVIRALRHPVLPVPGVHVTTEKVTVSLDHHRLHIEVLASDTDSAWTPTFGQRRSSKSWTQRPSKPPFAGVCHAPGSQAPFSRWSALSTMPVWTKKSCWRQ